MKKLIIIILFLLVTFTSISFAQVSVNGSTDISSMFAWRGFVFVDGWVIQPTATISHNSGLAFNIFGSFPLSDRDLTRECDEVDLTLSYSKALSKTSLLNLGVITYNFPRVHNFPCKEADVLELFGTLAFSSALNPCVSLYYSTNKTFGDGPYACIGISSPLGNNPKFPMLTANLGYNGGTWGMEKSGFSNLDIGLTFPFSKNIYAGLHLMTILSDELKALNNNKSNEVWFNLGIKK